MHTLVTRHNVELKQFDANSPLSVGNGQFCFTVDATGLQTFPEAFAETTPLGTLPHFHFTATSSCAAGATMTSTP